MPAQGPLGYREPLFQRLEGSQPMLRRPRALLFLFSMRKPLTSAHVMGHRHAEALSDHLPDNEIPGRPSVKGQRCSSISVRVNQRLYPLCEHEWRLTSPEAARIRFRI